LHIQWNPLTDSVEVINYSIVNGAGLVAKMEIFDINGTQKARNEVNVDARIDSRAEVMAVNAKQFSGVYFVRLELSQGGKIISTNEYLRGDNPDAAGGIGDLTSITALPVVKPSILTTVAKQGNYWIIISKLNNPAKTPAFNVRLMAVGSKTGERILPASYDDNYFTLLPGDSRTITMKVADEDTRGETPEVKVQGFNVSEL